MSGFAKLRADEQRRTTKALEHLMGLITGFTADRDLNDEEILYLDVWLKDHPETTCCWPGDILARKLHDVLADKRIESVEREHLLSLLISVSGNYFSETGAAAPEVADLPIDDQAVIIFDGRVYCFTGEFVYGTRSHCERAVVSRGGYAVGNVSKKIDYIVIGSRVSPNWAHMNFGRKIQKAVELKNSGHHINIVSESYWVKHL